MSANNNSQVVALANSMISLAAQLYNLQQQISAVNTQFTQLTAGTTFAAMSTCAVNADGSLGAADSTPSNAHPIDPRVYTSMSRAVSSNQLAQLNTLLGAYLNLVLGSTVAQQGQSPQLLNQLIGG